MEKTFIRFKPTENEVSNAVADFLVQGGEIHKLPPEVSLQYARVGRTSQYAFELEYVGINLETDMKKFNKLGEGRRRGQNRVRSGGRRYAAYTVRG